MDLVKELNLDKFTEEEKNEVLAQLADSLLKRLMLRVYDKLNEGDQQELDKLTKGGNVEKVNEFLTSKVPDLEQIKEDEMRGLVEEMKDFLQTSK